ncbi:MAG: adenylyltransferase/cytidyltransferase family protein [Candidatus Moranbacteria bacterium]|nr:adenylyltransferase/cytidyltransferase family protein [Candidatus Moranbacteria bacterium]
MNNKTALFIGRWQPPHEGHKKLICSVLAEGKRVIIAVRDTKISANNPFTYVQRKKMLQEMFDEFFDHIKIIKIPDISEVCYGRNVGYTVREIRLDENTEKISATNIRKQFKLKNPQ